MLCKWFKKAVTMNFDKIIEKVLKHEGGYVNDKDDPGGETNMGVSKKAYSSVSGKSKLKRPNFPALKSRSTRLSARG